MKPKCILLTAVITFILTIFIIFSVVFFILDFNKKPQVVLSVDSSDGVYNAYVEESPSIDPPNQSLFIAKNGTNNFRLVEDLPEDIDRIKEIIWSPDSKRVVYITDWYLIITNVEKLNTKRISINPDWWKWHKVRGGTFSSSNRIINLEQVVFINSDTLKFKTSIMSRSEKLCITDI